MRMGRALGQHLVVVIVALAGAGCASIRFGELDPPEGQAQIVDVSVAGNRALTDGTLTEGLATYSDNASLEDKKPLLQRALLPADARRIESAYAAHGYFDARVTGAEVEIDDQSLARVRFAVEEGEPSRIRDVRLDWIPYGSEADPEAPALLDEVRARALDLADLQVGEVWTEEAHEAAKLAIRDALIERGFLYALVLGDARVAREAYLVLVDLHVLPGPLTRVSEVRVAGNRRIPTARIMRRVDVAPGDRVRPYWLRRSEEQVYALRAFYGVGARPLRVSLDERLEGGEVTLEAVRGLSWAARVPVEVSVQEMPIHTITAGVGTTIETTRNEAYARGGYENRDFFGGLRYFDAELKPALVTLPNWWTRDALHAPAGEARLRFVQPSFFEEYLELGADGSYALDVQLGHRSHRVRGLPSLTRTFFSRLTLRLAYDVLFVNYFSVSDALHVPQAELLGLSFRDHVLLAVLVQQALLDLRDVPYDPRKGLFASVELGESLETLGSDFHFVRLEVDLRGYWSPWSRLTLAARLAYGQVFNALGAETPLPARFVGGGANDVRGFGDRRMGPFLCASNEGLGTDDASCDADKVFVGGNVKVLGSLEARVRVWGDLALAAFADAGEIWASRQDLDLRDLNVAVGPGFRYHTAFGPIRLDVAWLVTPPDPGRAAFHLSIGHAF